MRSLILLTAILPAAAVARREDVVAPDPSTVNFDDDIGSSTAVSRRNIRLCGISPEEVSWICGKMEGAK